MKNNSQETERTGLEIAVIGMAGRFPGAGSIDEFWENIKNGVESISHFTREESLADGASEARLDDPNFVNSKGVLNDVDCFDAVFFGYTPAEAELMDPQMRVFHEVVWWAMEHAGYSPDNFDGRIGIVAGATNNRGWESRAIFSGKTAVYGSFASDHLMDRDFLSTRMAYRFNLTGPAITMKTACSSSLVAVDLACRLLLTGQCDMALAGGTSVTVPVRMGYTYEEGMIKSPDGHVRAFDVRAKGVVFSDGVGVAVLKRLEEAEKDGDSIMAVIKGSAINNDGGRKGSYTAPGVDGQTEVIRAAHLISGVDPETITFVETHGTGTTIGDPIEIESLTQAFDTDKRNYCAITSTKSNVGHMDTAAGIGSFVKAVLSLHNGYIPPSLNFEKPNPKIDFANSPFYVNTELKEWPRGEFPRRAGVSSFGVGGTNVHAILEEAPAGEPVSAGRTDRLILLSAKNSKALEQMTINLREHLKANPQLNLPDAAYTLQVGRSAFKMRQMLVVSTTEEAIACLTPPDENTPFDIKKVFRGTARDENRPVFMFSGQGSQYINMGLGLYETELLFREEMDRCFEIFRSCAGYDLKAILYPPTESGKSDKSDSDSINNTEIAQPVLFIIEYSLARLLMKWGIKPRAMTGHSIGEYAAACLAGVFSLEDAVKIVTLRGKLMQRMTPGSMLSVPLPEAEVQPLLEKNIELAAVNAPNLCVLSGPDKEIRELAGRLKKQEVQVRILHTSHAFHSKSMEPMLAEFEAEVAKVNLSQPQIPYISNLTGAWITAEEAVDPGYYARHLRSTVRFAAGLGEILKDEYALPVEVGPGRALSTFARQHDAKKPAQAGVNLMRHPKEQVSDSAYLLEKIGRLWLVGQDIDWQAFYEQERRRRIRLPLYPFQGQSFWIHHDVLANLGSGEDPNKKKDFDDWFYIPSWKRSVVPVPAETGSGDDESESVLNWLFFTGQCNIGAQIIEKLRREGHNVVTVAAGSGFARPDEGRDHFTIDPRQAEDYLVLLKTLKEENKLPQRVVHLWNLTPGDSPRWGADWEKGYLDCAFYSLLYLAQAMSKVDISEKVRLTVLSNRVHEVVGGETIFPEKAVLLGPVNVIPQEFPNISCSSIDLILPEKGSLTEQELLRHLLQEIKSDAMDEVIAYRSGYRLVRTFEAAALSEPISAGAGAPRIPRLRQGGVYLISGGLGGVGFVFAEYLSKQVQPALILTGRSAFPEREEWEQWLSSHPSSDPVSRKIDKVRQLEELGAGVLVLSVDVTDYAAMEQALCRAREHFGPVNGVIHAAGLPGAGIIQLKTGKIADSVLLPKVRGTLILDSLLKNDPLDFILLCSSINSVVPQLGQVDYFAANAFLDAYAFHKRTGNVFTVSVNWDAWQEVGMAVAAAGEYGGSAASAPAQALPLDPPHPLLEKYTASPGERMKYTGRLTLEKNWPLNEHKTTDGKGLLPGTTYLEMIRAAYEHYSSETAFEISSANFVIPLMVNKDDEREVYLYLERQKDFFQVRVESTLKGDTDMRQRHVVAEVRPLKSEEPRSHNIEELKKKCNVREIIFDKEAMRKKERELEKTGEKPQGLLVFGPRWKTMKWTRYGKDEGLTLFELPAEYAAELEQYKLHPALLDTCTGFMFGYVGGGKPYIPFAYKKLVMFRPLPATIICYNRLIGESSSGEFLRFNVILMDEEGRECVTVEEFTMLQVSEDIEGRIRQKEHAAAPRSAAKETAAVDSGELNERQRYLLRTGIRPGEGIAAFERILSGETPQVVVSTIDLPMRIERQKSAFLDRLKEADREEGKSSGPKHARPEISTVFVEPGSETEKKIALFWEEQLGISGVGLFDDFFELGGDSLKAVTILGKVQKASDVEVPISEFFNNPTVKGLSEFVGGSEEESKFYSIEPAPEKDYYPLSSAQKRLYIVQQMEIDNVGYNLPEAVFLEGDIRKSQFQKIFEKLIERHESFRTSFEMVNDEPVQRIHKQVEFEVEYYDAVDNKDFAGKSIDGILRQLIRPFDLTQPPLLRVCLVRTEEKKFQMLLDMHHIISDGVSQLNLFAEIMTLIQGGELLPLRLQYKDYSEWKNSPGNRERIEQQGDYWHKRFAGEIPEINLPLDYERPAVQDFAGGHVYFNLAEDLKNRIDRLTGETETTLYMVLLAAYYTLLSKYTRQEDIVVGSPISGRGHLDLQHIIGMFVNMLPLRQQPVGEKTFAEFLKEVKKSVVDAFENQEYQFDDMVNHLDLQGNPSRNPIFNVVLAMQNMSVEGVSRDDIKQYYGFESGISKFDLLLNVSDLSDPIVMYLEYKTKLFKKSTIERIAKHYIEILEQLVENKDLKLKDIKLSTGAVEMKNDRYRQDEGDFDF